MTNVGYIGLGLMGTPMARRLLAAGLPVTVWNRSRPKADALAAEGARVADTPADVARAADVVFTCVSDTAAVQEVVFGTGGVREGAAAGKVLVDLSSIQPDATRDMAEQLRRETGMGWVDAPGSGGVPGAEKGTLAIMAGGAEEDVERVRPVVAHLSQRFTRMGPNGAGQTTKLCNQVIVSCTLAVLAEATKLAEDAGVDAARIPECLKGGFADSIPMQLFVPRMAARSFDPPQTRVKTMLKDVVTAQQLAESTGTRLPMTEAAVALYHQLKEQGLDDADLSCLITLFE